MGICLATYSHSTFKLEVVCIESGLRDAESIFTRRRILVLTHPDSGFLLMHMMASGRYRGRGLRFFVFQGIK